MSVVYLYYYSVIPTTGIVAFTVIEACALPKKSTPRSLYVICAVDGSPREPLRTADVVSTKQANDNVARWNESLVL